MASQAVVLGLGPQERASAELPLSPHIALKPPICEFVYEAIVELGQGFLRLGMGPLGERTIVPITGGRFEGPNMKGIVLGGGADRQVVRADGATLLDALYELQTEDGAVITVNNKALITKRPDGSSYAFSQLNIIAPVGPHAWLNHLVFVGDLHFDPEHPETVLIRVYSLA